MYKERLPFLFLFIALLSGILVVLGDDTSCWFVRGLSCGDDTHGYTLLKPYASFFAVVFLASVFASKLPLINWNIWARYCLLFCAASLIFSFFLADRTLQSMFFPFEERFWILTALGVIFLLATVAVSLFSRRH